MAYGFFQDEQGNFSSKRLALIVSSITMSAGVGAVLFAKAVYVYQNGGNVAAEVMAAAAPLCAMAGVSYVWGKKIDCDANAQNGGNQQ